MYESDFCLSFIYVILGKWLSSLGAFVLRMVYRIVHLHRGLLLTFPT